MMTGFDDMVTIKSDYTDQNGIHYGKSDIERGGYHSSTVTAIEYAFFESPDFKDTKDQRRSLLKRKQDSCQTLYISQHLTLSELFRPTVIKVQR